jgi:aspartate/methionine/tyrosine aminotransferase
MQSLNVQFNSLRQSATVAMADRILALKASGQKIIGLQVGDPDFSTPQAVQEVAFKAMQDGLTHYGPSQGYLELRQAAALKLERDSAVTYDPETELLITHGGIHAYYLAMQSILNPSDEVLIPDPTWATHANMATMLRGKVVRVPAPAENGFIPHFESWEKAITSKTRVIVLNYPSNPTGAYPTREYLQKLQDFAAEHNLWIVSDAVYEDLYYGERPTSAAVFEGAKERTLLVNSLSKSYAMTGWRVGYLAAPQAVIDNALKAGQNSITCVAPFIQKPAAFALTDPGIQQVTANMRAAYARRRDLVLRISHELESAALTVAAWRHVSKGEKVLVTPPQGAFYFFLDFRPLKMTSLEICERLLEEARVGLVPGSAFGEYGEGFVRMTIAASDEDVEAGFRAIVNWAEKQ